MRPRGVLSPARDMTERSDPHDDADHRSAWRAWVAALDAIEQPGPGLIGSGEESAIEALIAETEAAEVTG